MFLSLARSDSADAKKKATRAQERSDELILFVCPTRKHRFFSYSDSLANSRISSVPGQAPVLSFLLYHTRNIYTSLPLPQGRYPSVRLSSLVPRVFLQIPFHNSFIWPTLVALCCIMHARFKVRLVQRLLEAGHGPLSACTAVPHHFSDTRWSVCIDSRCSANMAARQSDGLPMVGEDPPLT
jgi:hypothetical protein